MADKQPYRGSYAIVINLEEESANSKSRAIAGGLGAITTGILVGGGLYVLNRNMSNRRAQTNESAKASPTWPPNRQIKLLNAEERLYEDTQNVVPVKTEFPEPPIQVTNVAIETEKPNNEPYEDLSVHKDVFEYVLSPGPQGSQGEKEDSKTEESKEESPKVLNNDQLSDRNVIERPFILPDDFFLSKTFPEHNYNVDLCLQRGTRDETSQLLLAFYYLKILSDRRRQDIFLNLNVIGPDISYGLLDRTNPDYYSDRKKFHNSLNKFISDVPSNVKLGITLMALPEHSTLLIFDVANQRLEFYESNGRDMVYDGISGKERTVYNYFVRNIQRFRPRVCRVWSSDKQFQGQDGSCAMWSTVHGICRMSGVERSQLPTDIKVVTDISRSIRVALWNTCQFSLFTAKPYNVRAVEETLLACVVPPQDIASICKLVLDNLNNELIPVPDEVDVCGSAEERFEQKIDCQNVDIDAYKSPLDVDELGKRCGQMDKITFRGSPRDFPDPWFSLTNHIILRPRSTYVNLNTDFEIIANEMKKHKRLRVEANLGIVNLSKTSILDNAQDILPRLTVNRVLILGDLPPDVEYIRKVKLLGLLTTPYMALLYRSNEEENPAWRRKTSPLMQHFVLRDKWYSTITPWSQFLGPFIAKGSVFFSLQDFESANLPFKRTKQQFDTLSFDSPLSDDDVRAYIELCDGKVGEITFKRATTDLSLLISSLTDRVNFGEIVPDKKQTVDVLIGFIVNLLKRSVSVHVKEAYGFGGTTEATMSILKQITTEFPGRFKMDRILLSSLPSEQELSLFSLLAQTVFTIIHKNTSIQRVRELGLRYFLMDDDYKENGDVVNFLAEPIAQKRVVFSYREFWDAAAPKNRIYPWVKGQDNVTFDIEPSPPTDEEIEAFQKMCPQVRKSNIKNMSNEKIILTIVDMTTDELNIGTICLHTDSPLINQQQHRAFRIT